MQIIICEDAARLYLGQALKGEWEGRIDRGAVWSASPLSGHTAVVSSQFPVGRRLTKADEILKNHAHLLPRTPRSSAYSINATVKTFALDPGWLTIALAPPSFPSLL